MSATENETAVASKTVDDVARTVQVADTIEPAATTAPIQISDDATEAHQETKAEKIKLEK